MLLDTDKIVSVAGTRGPCSYDKCPIILISINKYARVLSVWELSGTF